MSNRKLFKIYSYIISFTLATFAVRFIYNKFFNLDLLIENIRQKDLKSVHMITGRFDFWQWQYNKLGEAPFKKCPETRCYAFLSFPMTQTAIEKADGVLVHGPNLWYLPDRRTYQRNPKQLWLLYSLESQRRTWCSSHVKLTDMDDWFNLTATVKQDSSIMVDYRQFRSWDDLLYDLDYTKEFEKSILPHYNDPTTAITDLSVKQKRPFIAWYVSHCETPSRREDYVKEMMKYVDVDVFGGCVNYFPDSRRDPCRGVRDIPCTMKLMNKYKFYLAFENSLCTDYVTEKYWKLYDSDKIFKINMIPIVRGASKEQYKNITNREKFYLHVDDFKSPKALAEYLHYLNNNDTAYLEFFGWKTELYKNLKTVVTEKREMIREHRNVSLWNHLREPFCEMCSKLHDRSYMNSKTNKVWRISEWFNPKIDCSDKDEKRPFLLKFVNYLGYCI
jgi:hypothetical protein